MLYFLYLKTSSHHQGHGEFAGAGTNADTKRESPSRLPVTKATWVSLKLLLKKSSPHTFFFVFIDRFPQNVALYSKIYILMRVNRTHRYWSVLPILWEYQTLSFRNFDVLAKKQNGFILNTENTRTMGIRILKTNFIFLFFIHSSVNKLMYWCLAREKVPRNTVLFHTDA